MSDNVPLVQRCIHSSDGAAVVAALRHFLSTDSISSTVLPTVAPCCKVKVCFPCPAKHLLH
jgi:hypothetical protein